METEAIIILAIAGAVAVATVFALRRGGATLSREDRDRVLRVLKERGSFSEARTFAAFSRGFAIDDENKALAIIDLPKITFYGEAEILSWQSYRQTSAPPIERASRPTKKDVTGIGEVPHPGNGFITFWLGEADDPMEETFDMGPPRHGEQWARRLETTFPRQRRKP